MRLETRLDRRQFLKYGTVAVVGGLVLADKGGNTTHEYYANKELLEQTVRMKSSPFVRNVVYDHTESLETRADYSSLRRVLDDAQVLRYISRYFFRGGILTEQYISAMLESPSLFKDALAFISRVYGLRINKSDDAGAKVIFYHSDFGKGIKHDVYVFRSTLDRLSLAISQGDIEIPVENRLITTLEHEYTHAEDIFKGIDLGNGMVINGSNYFDIHPMVTRFVLEERAYRKAMELAKQQFGETSGVYWHELLRFILNNNRTRGNLEGLTLSDYDRELVRLQMGKSDELSPEIKRFEEKFGR